jgi:hypothetical protein
MAEQQFPIQDGDYVIDFSPEARDDKGAVTRKASFRVYYWAERPDAKEHVADDKHHWHPDSEHDSLEAAQSRVKELKGGGKRKSIYRHPK